MAPYCELLEKWLWTLVKYESQYIYIYIIKEASTLLLKAVLKVISDFTKKIKKLKSFHIYIQKLY